MDYSAVGQTTNLAARMEQLAAPGTTVITAETLRLIGEEIAVRPLGRAAVKGLPDAVEAYEILEPRPEHLVGGPAAATLEA